MNKLIKSDSEYRTALGEIEVLIDKDPDVGTPDADRLELLAVLVQNYESARFGTSIPDPIDAIQFRMEQQSLSRSDLVPYIGSRSKVSEILGRKRPLTLSMIRALHSALGIPAEVLLQHRNPPTLETGSIEWERFPVREMLARGWIAKAGIGARDATEDLLRPFVSVMGSGNVFAAVYRRTQTIRSARSMDPYALLAWTARIRILAAENPPPKEYKPEAISLEFMRHLVRLSTDQRGPLLAREHLREQGILLIIERHLPRTYLDGAAIMSSLGTPVIGMTLRHDRIDNFWFCLMHELAHVRLHIGTDVSQFYDDLDLKHTDDPRETEADQLAQEALIPSQIWKRSPASRLRSRDAVLDLANQLGVHPAIVAGRIRLKYKAYRVLSQLVGHGQVRRLF